MQCHAGQEAGRSPPERGRQARPRDARRGNRCFSRRGRLGHGRRCRGNRCGRGDRRLGISGHLGLRRCCTRAQWVAVLCMHFQAPWKRPNIGFPKTDSRKRIPENHAKHHNSRSDRTWQVTSLKGGSLKTLPISHGPKAESPRRQESIPQGHAMRQKFHRLTKRSRPPTIGTQAVSTFVEVGSLAAEQTITASHR